LVDEVPENFYGNFYDVSFQAVQHKIEEKVSINNERVVRTIKGAGEDDKMAYDIIERYSNYYDRTQLICTQGDAVYMLDMKWHEEKGCGLYMMRALKENYDRNARADWQGEWHGIFYKKFSR